jgi:IS605 OrfB family transposase
LDQDPENAWPDDGGGASRDAGQAALDHADEDRTGKYFAACLFDDETAPPTPPHVVHDVIGVDVGLAHVAIESRGRKTENPKFLKRAQRNLGRKQKALSRKQKGSKNRAKAWLMVAKAHEKVANARADFQHKLSKRLVDENQAIIVETLRVRNMLKNRSLARAISDAGWHSLTSKFAYKAERAGRHFVKLDQWEATSKTCADCGHRLAELARHSRLGVPGLRRASRSRCQCGAQHSPSRHRSTTGERFARPCPWRPA